MHSTERSSEAAVAERQYLNDFLIRDRASRVLLTRAETSLREGDSNAALRGLQLVWDAAEDSLVWVDAARRTVSARRRADELMRRLDPAARDAYEREHGAIAGHLLEAVLADGDRLAERELLRRFRHTRAGGELLQLKAWQALDRGEMTLAARLLRGVLDDDWQRSGLDRAQRAAAEAALALSNGRPEASHRHALLAPSLGGPVMSDRVTVPIREALWSSSHLGAALAEASSTRLAADESGDPVEEQLLQVISDWRERQQARRLPLAGAAFAIVADGAVIVRDFSHVTARDVRSGEVRWRYRCDTSLWRLLSSSTGEGLSAAATPRNDAVRAEMFSKLVAGDSVLGTCTSDGERVYLIDGVERLERSLPEGLSSPDGHTSGTAEVLLRNRLVALPLAGGPENARPCWFRGGRDGDVGDAELQDFYFLGPPTPVRDVLFACGEQNQQLQIAALDAASGELLWKQPISFVDASIAVDELRAHTACTPLVSEGVLVCPTLLPILTGLDAVTGEFLWVDHAAGRERPEATSWRRRHDRRFDPDADFDPPLIVGGRILHLPREGRKLHCLDLQSGRPIWSAEAADARFIAAADADTVMLVYPQDCVGLSLEDGRRLWKTSVPQPAGRGTVGERGYLLPLTSGRLACITFDGELLPDLLDRGARRLERADSDVQWASSGLVLPEPAVGFRGNLVAYDDLIVCSSSTGVSVFPQARAVLDELTSPSAAANDRSPEAALRLAVILMQLGEAAEAMPLLRQVASPSAPPSLRDRAIDHLRELLYLDAEGDAATRLAELERLAATPAQRGRYLAYRLEHELRAGSLPEAAKTIGRIARLGLEDVVPMDRAGRYAVRPLEHARLTLEQFAGSAGGDEATKLRRLILSELGGGASESALAQELWVLFGGWTARDHIARRLAEDALATGNRQSGELILLSARNPREDRERSPAERNLAALWSRSFDVARGGRPGARPDAAPIHGPASLVPQGAEFAVAYRPSEYDGWSDIRVAVPGPRVLNVEVREIAGEVGPTETDGGFVGALFDGSPRLTGRLHGRVRLIERDGRRHGERVDRFAVIDAERLEERGTIDLPPARWRFPTDGGYWAGHAVPVAGQGVAMISLLEQRVLWHAAADPDASEGGPLLGPYGPGFCVLQTGQTIEVVDPIDGRPLWRRRDLRFGAGLTLNEQGLIGDERVLVVFDPDKASYTLYDTRSGRRLRAGTLPISADQAGRRRDNCRRWLIYRSTADGATRLRVWDPLFDALTLDETAERRLHYEVLDDGRRLAVLNGGSLKVVDIATGDHDWELSLTPQETENVQSLVCFSTSEADFVLLKKPVRNARSSTAGRHVAVASQTLSGDLYAVDRRTGQSLWHDPRTIAPCTLLELPEEDLPFLVILRRTPRQHGDEGSALTLELLDIASGEPAAVHEDLTLTRILHTTHDPARRRLTLWEETGRVEIDYATE